MPSTWRSGGVSLSMSFPTQTRERNIRRSHSGRAAEKRTSAPRWDRSGTATITRCAKASTTLECELLDKHRFRKHKEAELAIFDFIEGWYNLHRRHSALDYRSPAAFERETAA